MDRIFGIDFGTTTTAFAAYDYRLERIDPIANEKGTPFHSVVVLDNLTGDVFSRGLSAWQSMQQIQDNKELTLIRSVKRELQKEKSWHVGGKIWRPLDVAVEILALGIDTIRQRWSDTVFPIKAVVAVPVDFGNEDRSVVAGACEKVGIDIIQFVSEPTAALAGSDIKTEKYKNILVFDWGGGTLDISVIESYGGIIAERNKGGVQRGGDDMDKLLGRRVHEDFCRRNELKLPFSETEPVSTDFLLTAAESCKRTLSNRNEASIFVPKYYEGKNLRYKVQKNIFNGVSKPIYDEVEQSIGSTLKESGLALQEIDLVVAVGGSCQIPEIKKMLTRLFPGKCEFPTDSEWAIAKGAANIAKNQGAYSLAQSIGLMLSDGRFLPVLRKDDPINHEPSYITLGVVDDSKDARIVIAEGEGAGSNGNNYKMIDNLCVNTQGYYFEPVEVCFYIKKDLSLKIDAKSRISDPQSTIYPDLKLQYNLQTTEEA